METHSHTVTVTLDLITFYVFYSFCNGRTCDRGFDAQRLFRSHALLFRLFLFSFFLLIQPFTLQEFDATVDITRYAKMRYRCLFVAD